MPTALEDLFDQIESAEFVARVGVVSTLTAFESAVGRDTWVRELLGYGREDDKLHRIIDRVRGLLDTPVAPGFGHPLDIAIAVYLRTIDVLTPVDALRLARTAIKTDVLWWARKFAERILSDPNSNLTVRTYRLVDSAVTVVRGARGSFNSTNLIREIAPTKGITTVTKSVHSLNGFIFHLSGQTGQVGVSISSVGA